MTQEDELEETFKEEYTSAMLLKDNSKIKSSIILLSKSLFAICDYIIFKKYGKLPKSHSERFRILELKEKEIYHIVDSVWSKYTDTYSKPSQEESFDLLNKAIKEITQNESISPEIKQIVK